MALIKERVHAPVSILLDAYEPIMILNTLTLISNFIISVVCQNIPLFLKLDGLYD